MLAGKLAGRRISTQADRKMDRPANRQTETARKTDWQAGRQASR